MRYLTGKTFHNIINAINQKTANINQTRKKSHPFG